MPRPDHLGLCMLLVTVLSLGAATCAAPPGGLCAFGEQPTSALPTAFSLPPHKGH